MKAHHVSVALLIMLLLLSCAPVFDHALMKEGARNIPLSVVRENPDAFRGRLFILGGIIVSTKLTERGATIEALAVPVDSYGYLKYDSDYGGRFLALYPGSRGFIDPMVFSKGREITIAGEFVEIKKGKIDEMEYAYPLFQVRQLHLWPEKTTYYYGYPYSYYPYWYYDPWWRPYPYGYPYYYWPPR